MAIEIWHTTHSSEHWELHPYRDGDPEDWSDVPAELRVKLALAMLEAMTPEERGAVLPTYVEVRDVSDADRERARRDRDAARTRAEKAEADVRRLKTAHSDSIDAVQKERNEALAAAEERCREVCRERDAALARAEQAERREVVGTDETPISRKAERSRERQTEQWVKIAHEERDAALARAEKAERKREQQTEHWAKVANDACEERDQAIAKASKLRELVEALRPIFTACQTGECERFCGASYTAARNLFAELDGEQPEPKPEPAGGETAEGIAGWAHIRYPENADHREWVSDLAERINRYTEHHARQYAARELREMVRSGHISPHRARERADELERTP